MAHFIDVTLGMKKGMISFPGDPVFEMKPVLSLANSDPVNTSLLTLCSHSGTHVDPPAHYIKGARTVDQIPLDYLIGDGIIIDMCGKTRITADDIRRSNLTDHIRVFFKTDNSLRIRNGSFQEDYCCLDIDGAEFLVHMGVKLVGIDYLSIEGYESPDGTVHKTILASGAAIVEGLDLSNAPAGPCRIYCLPMRIENADGAPARVVIKI